MIEKATERLRADPVIFWALMAAVFSEAVFGVVLLIYFQKLAPLVPLIYSLPWGERQLAPWWILPVLFVAGIATLAINALVAFLIMEREILLARIIMAGGSLTVLLLATTGTKIILLTHF